MAAINKGFVCPDTPITVTSLGGDLIVSWNEGEEIEMTGPAETVYDGMFL